MSEPEILVVGAGVVGLAFGISAAKRGFNVRVIDQQVRPQAPSELGANVLAVNRVSEAFLTDLGAWRHIDAKYRTLYRKMRVIDATGTGQIGFGESENESVSLGHIVNQSALKHALIVTAENTVGLSLAWQSEFDDRAARPALLVAADGVNSRVRQALGLQTVGFKYQQSATVCLVEFEHAHQECAFQWFHETGPVALLPLSEPNLSAMVWSCSGNVDELDDDNLKAELARCTERHLGEILAVGPRMSFGLTQRHALRYVDHGVALLGDAAHTIHPLAGQGANLGFADANALVTEICGAELEGKSPGDLTILKRFESNRRTENMLAGLAMEGFHRLFTSKVPLLGLLRNKGLNLIDSNPTLKRIAVGLASGGR